MFPHVVNGHGSLLGNLSKTKLKFKRDTRVRPCSLGIPNIVSSSYLQCYNLLAKAPPPPKKVVKSQETAVRGLRISVSFNHSLGLHLMLRNEFCNPPMSLRVTSIFLSSRWFLWTLGLNPKVWIYGFRV